MKISVVNGLISTFQDFNRIFNFFVENKVDLIQGYHLAGMLYENEELKLIQKHSAGCRVYFDIGSNVGNHAVFFAKILNAKKIYVFEANPATAEILKINILLNDISSVVNSSYLGMGLGSVYGSFQVTYPIKNNIGAAKLKAINVSGADSGGDMGAIVPVIPMDSLNINEVPDFVKIDVEGMELQVLDGMRNIISVNRPKMFIEVDNANLAMFLAWVDANNYEVIDQFKRYEANQNFLIASKNI